MKKRKLLGISWGSAMAASMATLFTAVFRIEDKIDEMRKVI
jgi:hypothetical protein